MPGPGGGWSLGTWFASRLRGFTGDRLVDSQPGGELLPEWDGQGSVFMTGPAVRVFDAEWLEA